MFIILLLVDNEEEQTFLLELYEECKDDMMRMALSILRPAKCAYEAEDTVQDAIETIIKEYREKNDSICEKKRGYIVSIVKHRAIDRLRKIELWKERTATEQENDDGEPIPLVLPNSVKNPEEIVVENEELERLAQYIRRLPDKYRVVMEKKAIFHLKNREIAEELGISQSSVSTKLQRARKLLEDIIREKEAEEVGR